MLRLIGQYVFNPESPAAIAMLLIVSFPLMALVARRICTDAKVAREQWPAAAIFFLMPSLILDTSVAAGCGARRCSPTVRSPRSTEKIRAWRTARMHSVFVQMLALPNARRDVDVALRVADGSPLLGPARQPARVASGYD